METGKQQGTRYDSNRRVKMILVRHGVNLGLLQWSSSRSTAYFYGILKKEPDGDFSLTALDALLKDLAYTSRIPRLSFHLDNWDINGESGSFSATKKKSTVKSAGGGDGPEKPVAIDRVERIDDVLKDMGSREASESNVRGGGGQGKENP